MKKHFLLVALAACAAAPAMAQNVGVSIGINQPGVYGRVDIGNTPPPVVYAQPVVISPGYYVEQRHWGRYCAQYGACGQPVYFVQEQWVRDRYEESHHRGHRRHDGWRDERDERHDHGRHEGWRER